MRAPTQYPTTGRYVITELGRLSAFTVDRCDCNPRLYGLILECPECGTVYGSIREQTWSGGRSAPKPD